MGKGSGCCSQQRQAITAETPGDPGAFELKMLPRKEQTVWETADARMVFVRRKEGWGISNAAIDKTGRPEDRQVLRDYHIIDTQGKHLAFIRTLSEAQECLKMLFEGSPLAPSPHLRQRDHPYKFQGVPFGIRRQGKVWKIAYAPHSQGEGLQSPGSKSSTLIYKVLGNLSRKGVTFPTRQAAYQTAEQAVRNALSHQP
jgi:hypothetical protein